MPGVRVLVDRSVWARTQKPAIVPVWAAALTAGDVVACPPFLLEAGYSARSADDLRRLRGAIRASMPEVACDKETWDLALAAQERMADAAGLMHRRNPMDLLVAAVAHQHGIGVLHYDHDYDLIAEHSGLRFASVWVVPAGSADQ